MDFISAPPAMPDGVYPAPTQVLDSLGVGVPIKLVKAFTASATSVSVFSSNCPYKVRVLDCQVLVTTKAAQTLTLKNGSNSITDAISLNPTNNNSKVSAGTYSPTYYEIAKGGSLSGALSAAGGAGLLIVEVVKVS